VRGRRVDASAVSRFWELRSQGLSYPAAAAGAGIGAKTAHRELVRAGGVRPRAPVAVSGRFLSLAEREEIAAGVAAGESAAVIARRLGRHRSSIGREITRFRTVGGGRPYRAVAAQQHAQARARRPKPAKLAVNVELRAWVQDKLEQQWSPQQIAATLRVEFPDRPEMRVSHETIYQSLYVQSRGALRRELKTCLRTGRAMRRPRRRVDERRGRFPDMVMISERPAEAADRAVPGHWEGDLLMGRNNASAIGTLVERASRFCLLVHLADGFSAEQVQAALIGTITTLPRQLRRSLTWDQGKELARHAQITLTTDIPIYFCDPHSPWQRGSNENTNGLLRQYFPKGTDLSVHSPDQLEFVANRLNTRPRETLGWQTPAQRLNELLSQ
jgi:IS30 family transposase